MIKLSPFQLRPGPPFLRQTAVHLSRLVIPVAGALASLVRPEGRALANPGGTEKFVHKKKIGHAFLKT